MKHLFKLHYLTLGLLCAASIAMAGAEPYAEIVKHTYKDGQAPRRSIKDIIRTTPADKIADVEARLLATLTHPDCTDAGKRFCFQVLRTIAGPATVKTLGSYLTDETYYDCARYAIESVASDDATVALRTAFKKSSGLIRIGIVMSLGERRDDTSVKPLAALLTNTDSDTANAVLQALANIGAPDAATALTKASVPDSLATRRQQALLVCAERLLADGKTAEAVAIAKNLATAKDSMTRIGVMSVLSKAKGTNVTTLLANYLKDADPAVAKTAIIRLGTSGGDDATAALVDAFDALRPPLQATALTALAMLKNKQAIATIKASLTSKDSELLKAAIAALGQVGSAADLDTFLALREQHPKLAGAIETAIASLPDGNIIQAVLEKAVTVDSEGATTLIRSLATRGDQTAVSGLLRLVSTNDGKLDRTIGYALNRIGGVSDVQSMLDIIVENHKTIPTLERSVITLILRNRANCSEELLAMLSKASGPGKASAIRILGYTGNPEIVSTITPFLTSTDELLVDAAVRGLCAHKHASTIGPMSDAVDTVKSDTHKILLSKAILRMLPKAPMSPEKTVAVLKVLIEAAPNADLREEATAEANKIADTLNKPKK